MPVPRRNAGRLRGLSGQRGQPAPPDRQCRGLHRADRPPVQRPPPPAVADRGHGHDGQHDLHAGAVPLRADRKSTRLNSSHLVISYAVFCLKKNSYIDHAAFLGTINPDTNKIPKHLFQGYLNIYNNYFKAPWMPDRTEANPNELNQDDARYGFRCCHLKNIWTAPLLSETELSRQMTPSSSSIDIMGLQAAYANLLTDQERDYFMQRYHDVISSFGGKTSYDADNRPLLVMRSNLWASGYDVDGTDQTSLGQFSGRVQQTYKHSVPRFFVPEHGTMFTLALGRFPPTTPKEIQYLTSKRALTYNAIVGDLCLCCT